MARPTDSRAVAVLGLWDGHDASVALVADGELVFALSEERPSRRKRHSGFPTLALDRCLAWAEQHGIGITDLAVAGRWGRAPLRLLEPFYARTDPDRDELSLGSAAIRGWENLVPRAPGLRQIERQLGLAAVVRRVARALDDPPQVHTVEHHEAHAWSALLGATDEPALVITWDAYGEGVALTLRPAEAPWTAVARHGVDVGLARLYGAVTQALGFGEGDEGKVMGLAARGDPDLARDRFEALFEALLPGVVGGRAPYSDDRRGAPRLRRRLTRRRVARLVEGLERADAAAALQATAEAQVAAWVGGRMRAYSAPRRLLLAGGLFANIRINQVLAGLEGVSGVFVFPNMVDGGLSVGAACRVWARRTGGHVAPIRHAFLGCEFPGVEIEDAANRSNLPWRRVADPAATIADHLAAGAVCRFTGRDEFGPRALGNRSILFSAADPKLGERVNEALRRDDFMPFGPVLRCDELEAASSSPIAARDLAWMTVSIDATRRFARDCPGAVHVDGTARPQVVDRVGAPDVYEILSRYREQGGRFAVINTSFNLHGEPIVHTPEDAVRTFRESGLDVLLLGDIEIRQAGARAG